MIFQKLVSASSLLLLASQLAPISANPVPESEAARRAFYDGSSLKALEDHFEFARSQPPGQHGESAEVETFQRRDLIPASTTKRDIAWNPSRLWGSGFAGGWGNQSYYHETECEYTSRQRYWYGFLTRAITYPDESIPGRQRSYWTNMTWWWINNVLPAGKFECNLYGAPKYNPGTQCVDKIWNPTAATWVARSSSNANSYWTTNNATYKNHKVRTIYDCLLNRTAIEYGDNVAAFGFKPVQYKLDGIKYYRFYDNNNFAWFAACPSTWPGAWKRHIEDVQKRGLLEKRCWDCKGINPVWDFFPPQARNPLADTTDIHDYADNIHFPEEFNEYRRMLVTYWPPTASRTLVVDGHTCVQAAVSRPGLRHWTVRFFDEAQNGYVQEKDEYEPQESDYL
ncbi:hypothetical protein TWF569_005992 [Orbilia oligospora]|nr:hypothetical protein TWF103_010676 [Orbilia oligospora]KAF3101594.1 hypothetical protein TWF102_004838 [Orbilia oligospora]KAF3108262.1 hypothetical protein TWF706_002156 [Orbilia oligospora]KAF3129004.1 hypothetical protein TWF594_011176 [Orbilia oligospora]KAF3147882.1 hypothetical protein TWF569_005992 [Orbilia oligospora]